MAVLLLSILAVFGNVSAQQVPTDNQIIDAQLGGPIFLNAYWIDRNASTASSSAATTAPVTKEVGPNEGAATLAVVLVNRGFSAITAIKGQLSLPQGFSPNGMASSATTADATFDNIANPGDTVTLYFDLDVSNNTRIGMYYSNLDVQYSLIRELGSFRNNQLTVPIKLTGKAILAVNDASVGNNVSSQIVAGKIEDFSFDIANRGTAPMTSLAITMSSSSESLKILGDSRWTIDRIDKGSQVNFATKVFAASALIGNPASFDVTIDYSSGGQSRSEKFTLGTYVAGEIALRVYDLKINYVGAAPTLVGNILNEGNTAALFATIELVQSEQRNQLPTEDNADEGRVGEANDNLGQTSAPASQYLGDIAASSPLPFSIPLNIQRNSEQSVYPVTLRITYKDNLRNPQEFVASGNAILVQQSRAGSDEAEGEQQGIGGLLPIVIWIGIAVAAAGAAVFAISRRRANAKKAQNEAIEGRENIEDILQNPAEGTKKDPPT